MWAGSLGRGGVRVPGGLRGLQNRRGGDELPGGFDSRPPPLGGPSAWGLRSDREGPTLPPTMTTAEQEWHDLLSGKYAERASKSPFRFLPSNPRCKLCKAPFKAPGGLFLRPFGFAPWAKNPRICGRCFKEIDKHARRCPSPVEGEMVAGAEVELSMLFADVRGSSELARRMSVVDF